ncbi:MAG TPA: hypothetical protein VL403_16695 [Candidatus Kryptonia bacterium]|nr:hypothetical protein [Candidatus Kryptonia bacterium]
MSLARQRPGLAAVLALAVVVGGYFLLNRKPKVVKEAERRELELKEQNRDRYRAGRGPG